VTGGTEQRLLRWRTRISALGDRTVPFRPSFDGALRRVLFRSASSGCQEFSRLATRSGNHSGNRSVVRPQSTDGREPERTGQEPPVGEGIQVDRMLFRPEEAAELLGIGRSKFYELMAEGVIDSVRIGACRRIPLAALEEYVERLRTTDDDDPYRRGRAA